MRIDGRNLGAELRQPGLHRVDDVDRVGVGLTLDRKHDGAGVIEPACDLVVLDAVDDVGDLAQPDRRAVPPGRDDVLVVRRPAHRARGEQRDVALGAGQRADRRVGVRLGQRRCGYRRARCCAPRPPPDRPGCGPRTSASRRQNLCDAGKLRDLLRQDGLAIFVDRRHRQVGEFRLMNRIGKSPGLTLRNDGGVVISTGSRRCATVSAVCTSSAAPSMSRLRSNWMVICVVPRLTSTSCARCRRWSRTGARSDRRPRPPLFGARARQGRRDLDGRKSTRGSAATANSR